MKTNTHEMSDKERIEKITKETIKEYYTAMYKAALLGLITFSKMTPDELIEEVNSWLHYHVDDFTNPIKEIDF